jgi:hypothetical protein
MIVWNMARFVMKCWENIGIHRGWKRGDYPKRTELFRRITISYPDSELGSSRCPMINPNKGMVNHPSCVF